MFDAKYFKGEISRLWDADKFRGASYTWKGVLHGARLVGKGVRWRVGSGTSIGFWTYFWVVKDCLFSHAVCPLPVNYADQKITDFLKDGYWDICKLRKFLPTDIVDLIISIPAGLDSGLEDHCIWNHSSNGMFSVKSPFTLTLEDPVLMIGMVILYGSSACLLKWNISSGY